MVYVLIFLLEFSFLFLLSRILVRSISQILGIRLFHLLFLPGVIIHELAHLIVAEVIFVRTRGLSFSPEQEEDRIVMGSVGIESTDPIRRAIIGFAPVFVGVLLIAFSVFYFLSPRSPFSQTLSYLAVFFIVFEIGNTMFSSRRDLEGTIRLLFVIALGVIAAYFLGFKIPDWIIELPNTDQFVSVIQKGIRILLFPIGIDLVVILLARFLNNHN